MIEEKGLINGLFQASNHSLNTKCVLELMPIEKRKEKDHMSPFYVHLMVGRYGNTISWPFRGKVKLQICNRCDNSDYIDFTIQFYNPARESSCN